MLQKSIIVSFVIVFLKRTKHSSTKRLQLVTGMDVNVLELTNCDRHVTVNIVQNQEHQIFIILSYILNERV